MYPEVIAHEIPTSSSSSFYLLSSLPRSLVLSSYSPYPRAKDCFDVESTLLSPLPGTTAEDSTRFIDFLVIRASKGKGSGAHKRSRFLGHVRIVKLLLLLPLEKRTRHVIDVNDRRPFDDVIRERGVGPLLDVRVFTHEFIT